MAEPFKNRINPAVVAQLAAALPPALADVGHPFDAECFRTRAAHGLERLELKARVEQVADAIQAALGGRPVDVARVGAALVAASGPASSSDERLTESFTAWPLLSWVERHALHAPTAALDTLEALTCRFSAEFAIRPFLERWPEEAWARVEAWTAHPSLHVRRLASEGTRPRLPWGQQLTDSVADPARGLAVLDRLVDDPERYVQRSVANHLGDVAKDHPERAVAVARRWLAEREDRIWVVRHGLRHPVKQGHRGALEVLGFGPPQVAVDGPLQVSPRVELGDALQLELTLVSTADRPQRLVIDTGVHFRKKRGELRPKVFKWTTRELAPGARVTLARALSLRPVSIRRHYPGTQRVDVRVNGEVVAEADFELVCDPGA